MMQAAYHLADFYIKNGQLKSAKEYLSKSLQLANEKEYYSFIQREFLDSQRVMDFARANNIEKSFVKFIVSTLYNRHETDWISQEAKARIKNKISELYDVTVTTFGKLEFKVKNYVIPESSWPKKKWKLILLYLFLSQKKEVTKDKLIDVFYTDTPLTSAENIFHQIVSKFRNLIKFNSESGTESLIEKTSKENKPVLTLHPSVFIYEDKTLKLNKELNYNIDIENFEKYYKLFSAESISDIKLKYAEKALSVYKGEFLDGFYESWVEELRTGIQLKTIEMNEEVLKILDNSEKYEQASLYADNLLKADKLNEDAYYYSIKAYINLNKISMAKDKFNVMLKAYKDEGIDIVLNSKYEKIKKLLNK
jgi:DNA-binding SARP family transcriptional activator